MPFALNLLQPQNLQMVSANLKMKKSLKNTILLISGIIFGLLFSGCVSWSHTVEHNQLKIMEVDAYGGSSSSCLNAQSVPG